MLTRRTAPLIALLSLIVSLIATLALACGPAAPQPQSAPPPAAADPTATATHTPTQTPEQAVTPRLEYVAQAVYRLAEQHQNQGASGASGTSALPQLPERIYIHVTAWTGAVDDLEQMLRDNGATDINVIKDGNASIVESHAPPTLLPDITRHPAFLHAFTYGIYPNMEQGLNDALTMYAGGVFTATETARTIMRNQYFSEYPENITVKIELDSPESYAPVRDFLAANDAFPHDIKPGASWFYAGVPVALMDDLYWHSDVVYIDHLPGYLDRSNEIAPSSSVPISEASQVTPGRDQGARVHGALTWHPTNKGENVAVGIIDSGFMGFAAQMGSDLPIADRIHYSCYNRMTGMSSTGKGTPDADTCAINDSHGTMVAEAIYDVAPGATFYISNDTFNEAVDWMTSNNVDIINYSKVRQWSGPGDGTSKKTSSALNSVKKAVSNGIFWVSAAGNFAEGYWFSRSVLTKEATGGTFVRFNGNDECNDVSLKAHKLYDFQLRWDGEWDGSNDDLSVEIWRNETRGIIDGTSITTLVKKAKSANQQLRSATAETDPYDFLSYKPTTSDEHYCLRVQVPSKVKPNWLQVQVWDSSTELEHNTAGHSIDEPGDSREAGMLTVGAAGWNTTGTIRDYSGTGPTLDGRVKPDIVGADGVYVSARGKAAFGTSQGTAHVTGLAALLLKRHTRYAPELLAYFLKSNAFQRITGTDPNNTWGHGFAWLPSPTVKPSRPTGATGTGGNQSITLSWSEAANATGYVVEQWDGRANPPEFRPLPFRETGTDGYNRLYSFKLTGAGAEIGNLVNGVRYTHRIKSTNGARGSLWANWVHTGAISPLAIPKNLRGTGRHRGVDLNWSDVSGATSYEVQQWDGRKWAPILFQNSGHTIVISGSSARIRGLTNGIRYYHRVQAKDGTYESGWTNWISTVSRGIAGDTGDGNAGGRDTQMPPPPSDSGTSGSVSGYGSPTPTPTMPQNQPSGLTARLTEGTVVLHWMPGGNPNYVKQFVKRREAGVRPEVWTDFEVDVSAQTYTDRTAQSGKTYIYRIKGLRDNGRGGTSNRATVTVR